MRPTALLAIYLSGACSRAALAQGVDTNRATEIRFTSRVPSSGGQVICALFRETGWLKKPTVTVKSPIRGHESTCVFAGVDAGTYAIVAFHDKNGNGSIDKNFLGIPTESWCTSRNATAVFGPPSFGAAKFLARAAVVRLSASM